MPPGKLKPILQSHYCSYKSNKGGPCEYKRAITSHMSSTEPTNNEEWEGDCETAAAVVKRRTGLKLVPAAHQPLTAARHVTSRGGTSSKEELICEE